MKIRRKVNSCLNCGFTLNSVYNYCPNCGQENNDNNVSFKTLTADFFNTYIALDSKFAKSVKPFFIDPGFLTRKYTEGKRVSYAHPIRLYLIISIFYFFIVSIVGKSIVGEDDKSKALVQVSNDIGNIEGLSKKEKNKLDEILSEGTIDKINASVNDSSNLAYFSSALLSKISSEERNELLTSMDSSSLIKLGLIESPKKDSIIAADIKKLKRDKKIDSLTRINDQDFSIKTSDDFILTNLDWVLLNKYRYDLNISNQQLFDSLRLPSETTGFEKKIVKQTIRVMRADTEQVVDFVLKNLPLMMLLLIPLFAFVLKLLYHRGKKELYIKHLIHALHLHTYAYFIYGVSLLIIHFFIADDNFQLIITLLTFLVVSVYAYISFLRVYDQKWFKTLVKFNVVGLIYLLLIVVFFLSELTVSMLLY